MENDTIYDYIEITIGSLLTAVGLVVFLIPNKIAVGGVSGLATVLHYIFDWKVGRIILLINIPLFIAGLRSLGAKFGLRTLYGILALSISTDLLETYFQGQAVVTTDLLLASIYGGGIVGLGIGLVFKAQGTTGGTDLVAQIISKYSSISVGKGLLIVDFFVIALAGLVFSAELALYALISLFIISRVIDLVQEGFNIAKATYIISDKSEEIRASLISDLNRGVTVLNGKGGYTKEDKEILLCIISRSEISDIKRIVHKIDKDAFVIITEAHEVLGEGFDETQLKEAKL
ncbi:MAG: YitT family protein [Bacillota bacterium]